jgi:hypothetical protein
MKTKQQLDTLMQKKWDALRKKLPYGLAWLAQSGDLVDWSENKKKKICEK